MPICPDLDPQLSPTVLAIAQAVKFPRAGKVPWHMLGMFRLNGQQTSMRDLASVAVRCGSGKVIDMGRIPTASRGKFL